MSATNYLERKGRVLCGLDPEQVQRLIDELTMAEIEGEIEVVGLDEADRLHHPPEDCGFSCQINRVYLGMGDDLSEYEWERDLLKRGQVIVAVPAANEARQSRVREIMAGYCQSSLHVYGRWTTKTL